MEKITILKIAGDEKFVISELVQKTSLAFEVICEMVTIFDRKKGNDSK